MTTATELTKDEMTFARRMLPHFMAGKFATEAAQCVLDDDARLFTAFFDRSRSYHVPTADERGLSHTTPQHTGDAIAAHMTGDVYSRLTGVER